MRNVGSTSVHVTVAHRHGLQSVLIVRVQRVDFLQRRRRLILTTQSDQCQCTQRLPTNSK